MANQEDKFLSPFAVSFDGEEERELGRLPVGFKFRPTDEELIQYYLRPKVLGNDLPCEGIIVDTNIYDHDPTQLAEAYAEHEKIWYFFTPRTRKYEKGSRPDRAVSGGFWKATAADTAIEKTEGDRKIKIGEKTALGFWETKKSRVRSIDRGMKTEWLMYEYKIEESKQPIKNGDMLLDDYVLSKIYRSCGKGRKKAAPVAVNPDNLQEHIQPPNKRARHQPEPERKPEPSFDPSQIQPELENPFLLNPETVQNQNTYTFQNQSLQTALLNPNQPPHPLDHTFTSSSENPILQNPEIVQNQNAYMFQNQSLQTALLNPNQPPHPLDHTFTSSSENPFLQNPEKVQNQNAYVFQNQSLQNALLNPNQPPDPFDHTFTSSSDDDSFPNLLDFEFPLDFDQFEPVNYQPNSPLPQGYYGESSIQHGMANFNSSVYNQNFQQLQNNHGVANFNMGVYSQNFQHLQNNYGDIHSPAQFFASTNFQPAELSGYNNFSAGYNGMEQCFNRPLFEPGSNLQNISMGHSQFDPGFLEGNSQFDPGFLEACLNQKRF